MTNAIKPSSPAADADPASRWWRVLRRQALEAHAFTIGKAALAVVLVGSAISVYLATAGTHACEQQGGSEVCTDARWYAFTIQKKSEVVSVDGNTRSRTEWYRNGHEWFAGSYDQDGARTGAWREFYVDGTPRFEATYAGDKIVGTETWYYPSGRVEWAIGRKDGARDGEERWYHENGQLRRIGTYANDKREGTFTVFDDEGNVAFKGEYKDGDNVAGSRVD